MQIKVALIMLCEKEISLGPTLQSTLYDDRPIIPEQEEVVSHIKCLKSRTQNYQ